ncbi:MAG: type II/IV secretion system ATPase subunit [Halobacteria archaeon]|nr:type II/IV secretion system ATPase subunit [Halobacteria archaeon]
MSQNDEGAVGTYVEAQAIEEAVEPEEETPPDPKVIDEVLEYFDSAADDELAFGVPSEKFVRESLFNFSYLDEYDERQLRYWVNKPYAYIEILYDDEEEENVYQAVEPALDDFEKYVSEDLIRMLRDVLMYVELGDEKNRHDRFKEISEEIIREYSGDLSEGSLYKIYYYLRRHFVDYGKIDPLMRDRQIEDISCDGVGIPIYIYHREYRDLKTNVVFDTDTSLNEFVTRMAQRTGKHISVSNPLVDTSLPDGSRVQLTLGTDISTRGSNFTVRHFAEVPITPVDLIHWNTFSVEEMAYFWLAIENNKSLIFAGGTASGKTTSMNAVSFFIPPRSKVVTIEDTREITLPHENWVASMTRETFTGEERGNVDMYDLLQTALRQRPEYLLVGEIRAQHDVALTFFQAMSTGHTSYTTFHADSIDTVIHRLEGEPLNVPRQMVEALDIVSIQKQIYTEGRRVRRTSEVVEVLEVGGGSMSTQTLFEWDPSTDTQRKISESSVLEEIRESHGWSGEDLRNELRNREKVLEYMLENGIRDYRRVARIISKYWKNSGRVMSKIENGEL